MFFNLGKLHPKSILLAILNQLIFIKNSISIKEKNSPDRLSGYTNVKNWMRKTTHITLLQQKKGLQTGGLII